MGSLRPKAHSRLGRPSLASRPSLPAFDGPQHPREWPVRTRRTRRVVTTPERDQRTQHGAQWLTGSRSLTTLGGKWTMVHQLPVATWEPRWGGWQRWAHRWVMRCCGGRQCWRWKPRGRQENDWWTSSLAAQEGLEHQATSHGRWAPSKGALIDDRWATTAWSSMEDGGRGRWWWNLGQNNYTFKWIA
jgi:hypothetical protein